ncbi:unnamed protein product (macronuclear) [Paramecium tetraurelia]|uniref:PUB domain-containing protein n=1 Tax=Paramecium tetraurelia TaxID=5888 RepID=A0C384_PARTE|nr:uncharacterized protein GSPATT00034729001 [Paramecium tetraurelia]CAK65251.1 unnamed protein product [Paramecium tetraurelia]|eukprot:XP_001432648.1 hypothetical protein (macronuclear) [Paramecium tetraurelia strain d4-2]
MGMCQATKRNNVQQNKKSDISQNASQVILDQYPMPKPKLGIGLPFMIKFFEQIKIIEVTESMALGVNQQKQVSKEQDYQCIYLYSEKAKIDIFECGFTPIDISRPDKIIEDKKQYKFLFDFKNLWVFRDNQEEIEQVLNIFKEINVKVKQIYLFTKPLNTFIEHYQMLGEISILNSYYPLLLFDYKDVQDATKRGDDTFRIYLHSEEAFEILIRQNQISLYNRNLQIRNLIFLYQVGNFSEKLGQNQYKVLCYNLIQQPSGQINQQKLVKELIPQLQNLQQMGSNIVLIYSSKESQGMKAARLAIEQYLARGLLIYPEDIQKYNEQLRSLQVTPEQLIQQQQQQENNRLNQKQQEIIQLSREQEIINLYDRWLKKIKAQQILLSSHNLFIKLITNIIQYPNDEKFRTIQKSNKTLNLNILQYDEGRQILQLIGFREGETDFKNIFELGLLKMARADIEIAWKKQLEKSLT